MGKLDPSSEAAASVDKTAPVAAIDCGTNTIRLLIAQPRGDRLVRLERRMIAVRLGEGVDRTGMLSQQALERTWAACREFRAVMEQYEVRRARFVATSASRDASNAAVFKAGVAESSGLTPEVISGEQEAALSFTGATRGSELAMPAVVFDIGGGSTEVVYGTSAPERWLSAELGCVRLTERLVSSDPLTQNSIGEVQELIRTSFAAAGASFPWSEGVSLVGLAGTVTTVGALALGLDAYDSKRIHGARLTRECVEKTIDSLLGSTTAQRAALPVMQPGRADVLPAGALILREILQLTQATELIVSESDILDGIAWSLISDVE